ncbi:MAG: 16S rRNA (cytosine(967)-C(5))-methyltransferase RsmB [Desulfocapsa sp.]|nr:16S rRNA (cytosine(967)-C(5))-methyltransferase RsmB [Desulfocapsa sp.]MBU4235187.1 16S rRNA (cytosine(967)-C(5))-methyltransferase RsmB [Pseudomonadota bacterium]
MAALPKSQQKTARTARFAAIETLCRLERTHLPASVLFDKVAVECELIGSERHLAMNLIYGVLRQRHALESLLQSLCRQPLSRIKPFVRQALLIGLYQIFFLDRIPESAAVNESVKALQTAHLPKNLQGFVNGVLRESLRQKQTLTTQSRKDSTGAPFLNHPDWLIRRWQERYGQDEMQRICASNNQQSPLILLVNTCAISRVQLMADIEQEGIAVQPGTYSQDTLILPDFHGAVSRLPGFSQGHFQVQDEGAGLLTLLLTPIVKNGHYLDACAGLGGKTGNLVQLCADSNATIAAVEPEAQRQQKFRENMQRLHQGAPVTLYSMDLLHFSQDCDLRFDGILVDAPCSGTGVTGRHPDIRWNRQEGDLVRYQQNQLVLLEQAAEILAPKGILVYATCSLEPEENEEVITLFLDRNPDFMMEDCTPFLPQAARHLVRDGFFAPLPGPAIDGFFGARLVKKHRPV